jgi:hypothetical protein
VFRLVARPVQRPLDRGDELLPDRADEGAPTVRDELVMLGPVLRVVR